MKNSRQRGVPGAIGALSLGAILTLTGCSGTGSDSGTSPGGDTGTLTFWFLEGNSPEGDAIAQLAREFEEQHKNVAIKIVGIPPADYTQTVLTTPTDELPDLMLVDGPLISSFAYNGKLTAIGDMLAEETISNQTPAVVEQNTWNDEVYAVSLINSGMGLWGNTEMLEAAGVTLPASPEDAWTSEEFTEALDKLAASDADGKVLTIAENHGLASEFGTYAFTPVLWSAGQPIFADGKAQGALDSSTAVEAVSQFQDLRDYTDPDTDGQAFQAGRVALAWMGHWQYGSYSAALGDNLVVGPLPSFGDAGAKAGSGSIAFGIGAGTQHAKLAAQFLDFLAADASVATYAAAAGAPPATITGLAASESYGPGGTLELLGNQLSEACPTEDLLAPDCVAVVRPVTPGYPIITGEIGKMLADVWAGANAQEALSKAARAIDRDFADNGNYEE